MAKKGPNTNPTGIARNIFPAAIEAWQTNWTELNCSAMEPRRLDGQLCCGQPMRERACALYQQTVATYLKVSYSFSSFILQQLVSPGKTNPLMHPGSAIAGSHERSQ
jgi:hypothetical protein